MRVLSFQVLVTGLTPGDQCFVTFIRGGIVYAQAMTNPLMQALTGVSFFLGATHTHDIAAIVDPVTGVITFAPNGGAWSNAPLPSIWWDTEQLVSGSSVVGLTLLSAVLTYELETPDTKPQRKAKV